MTTAQHSGGGRNNDVSSFATDTERITLMSTFTSTNIRRSYGYCTRTEAQGIDATANLVADRLSQQTVAVPEFDGFTHDGPLMISDAGRTISTTYTHDEYQQNDKALILELSTSFDGGIMRTFAQLLVRDGAFVSMWMTRKDDPALGRSRCNYETLTRFNRKKFLDYTLRAFELAGAGELPLIIERVERAAEAAAEACDYGHAVA